MKHSIQLLCAFVFAAVSGLSAQTLKVPAPSPLQTLKQAFALSDVTIEYSRPSAKGRVIFGDVVAYGKIWRTGANSATKITFGEDVKVQGSKVSAGTYALYTVPGKDSFQVMLYKDLKLGGDVANYNKDNEVLSFYVKTGKVTEKVETFTINVASITASSASIEMSWENTSVSFGIVADIDATIMTNIENTVNKDNRPYYQAATYYYENGKDLNTALTWVNKATEQNPKAYWIMLLKAKIENKLNDTAAAIISANKVVAMATEGKNADYVKMGEDLIKSIRKPAVVAPATEPKKKKK
ncbi:MAG: DUF2911 domain-containing protein [Chitinophagaceae bacterium]